MQLLLLSNSTNAGEVYLQHAKKHIADFLQNKHVKIVFIPYAGVTIDWDRFAGLVSEKFAEIGHEIFSIHKESDPVKAITECDVIVIGGGNTFHLLKKLQENKLLGIINKKVREGTPYIGWSAGANVACPTIMTTNDMPVVQPENFKAIDLVPFQINPHYLDANPAGHAGETRETRLREYIEVNPGKYVIGLREGTMLKINEDNIKLIGPKPARIFIKGKEPFEVGINDDLTFLLKQ